MRIIPGHELASTFNLDEKVVAIAGDWHSNVDAIDNAIGQLAGAGVHTILHLGDLWPTPDLLDVTDRACRDAGVERVLVTLGNHEPYDALPIHRSNAVRVSETVWILPRPAVIQVGGRAFLSLGGANSIDRAWRSPGRSWWPEEQITDEQRDRAIDVGTGQPIDVMLTHETVDRTPVREVAALLETNPHGWPMTALAYSAQSRAQVSAVWDAVRPRMLFHGHMHVPGSGITADGRHVYRLGMDGQPMNVVLLDLFTLTVRLPAPTTLT